MKKPAAKKAFRLTPQREAILRFLEGNTSHPSAEDIYARLRRKFPGMSFATVYNTLQSLLGRGDLIEVRIDRGRARFDPGLKPHHHLLCVRCGAITDLPERAPVRPAGLPRGYRLLSSNIEFYGICPACGKKEGRREELSCAKKRKK